MYSIPALQKRQIAYRSPADSHAYNEQQEDTFFDVVNLYNMINNFDRNMTEANDIFNVTNKFQQQQIEKLQDDLLTLADQINELKGATNGDYTARAFARDMVIDESTIPTEQATIDTFHSLVSLPIIKQTSKVYLYDEDTDDVIVPDTLSVVVEPTADDIAVIDNDPYNAFNGQNSSYWLRKVVLPISDPTVDVMAQVYITLPDNIISNREVNTINIHPFPLGSVDIMAVEYKLSGGWVSVPGFSETWQAGNFKLSFPSVAIAEVRVTIRQRHWLEENSNKVFYLGAEEIGIFYTENTTVGKINIPFDLSKGDAQTKLIKSITPVFKNVGTLTDATVEKRSILSFSIYTVDLTDKEEYVNNTLPAIVTHDRVVLKATLNADLGNQAAPVLESVELVYADQA